MMMEEITGRDEYIIRQALAVTLPFMLLYSPSISNTNDLMRIIAGRYRGIGRDLLGIWEQPIEEAFRYMLGKLEQGCRPKTANGGFQNSLVDQYFENLEEFVPQSLADEWRLTHHQDSRDLD